MSEALSSRTLSSIVLEAYRKGRHDCVTWVTHKYRSLSYGVALARTKEEHHGRSMLRSESQGVTTPMMCRTCEPQACHQGTFDTVCGHTNEKKHAHKNHVIPTARSNDRFDGQYACDEKTLKCLAPCP